MIAQALEDMIFSKLREYPVARGVVTSVEMLQIPQEDGTIKIEMVPTVGDVYMDEGMARCIARAVAASVYSHVQPELP